jgi:hypothetical protein
MFLDLAKKSESIFSVFMYVLTRSKQSRLASSVARSSDVKGNITPTGFSIQDAWTLQACGDDSCITQVSVEIVGGDNSQSVRSMNFYDCPYSHVFDDLLATYV